MTFLSLSLVLDAVAKASVILAVTALVAVGAPPRLGVRAAFRVDPRPAERARRAGAVGRAAALGAADRARARLGRARGRRSPSQAVAPRQRWQRPRGSHQRFRRQRRESFTVGGSTAPARVADHRPPAARRSRGAAIALFAWIAGAAVILGRMFLGLAAVLWLSRRTPVVTDAPWLAQAQSLAHGTRAVARPLPAHRRARRCRWRGGSSVRPC